MYMTTTKVTELMGVSSLSSDAAIKNAMAYAKATLQGVRVLDVISVDLHGDSLDEWHALVRVSSIVPDHRHVARVA